ncbi:MAG: DUF4251 domain-containing protein [Mediterranea sp.]|jgi:hypothetical protein|nr:DUF4251 domain-containing protein [Mediterranea sp.]
MKKLIVFMAFLVAGASSATMAQEKMDSLRQAKQGEKALRKAVERQEERAAYLLALKALQDKQFVLEADQVVFRDGLTAYVTSNVNFVLMNGEKSTVQVAFNTSRPGPNGIGGVTVDGTQSKMNVKMDKKGNVSCQFNVQGIGISAQVLINMYADDNEASVTISPNFSSNTLTLNGRILPLEDSNIFKGRSW